MRKFIYILNWLVIVLLMGFIVLITYWLNFPYKTIVFNNEPFPVDKKIYKVGEVLIYKVYYCKYTNEIPIVTRHYVNGIVYLVSSVPAVYKPKGCGVTNVQLIVPESLVADTYYLKLSYKYKVNPIRTITVEASSSAFMITK